MKTLEEVIQRISEHKSELADNYGVASIGIFGSYARGEQDDESDIDILVEFRDPIGLEVVDVVESLERILEAKVDLVTPRAIRPALRDRILSEVSYV